MNNNTIGANRIVAINVDPQNCFGPNGEVPVKKGDEVVPPLNKVNRYVRTIGGLVVASRDWHTDVDSEHFDIFGRHGIANTYGAEFLPGFELLPDDIVISKGQDPNFPGFSAFEGITDDGRTLEEIIRPEPGELVVATIGGLATEYCDLATALDATKIRDKYAPLGGKLVVIAITDAMRAVNINEGDEENALQELRDANVALLTSEEVINATYKVA